MKDRSDDLRVFVSWSGERSKQMAQAVRSWLPLVLHRVRPWMSTEIQAGSQWRATIARRLDDMHFGILCVTPENQLAPWLLFEAGALSKHFDEARVCPLVLPEMTLATLKEPLSAFNAAHFTEAGLFNLVRDLNALLGENGLGADPLRRDEAA